MKLVNSKVKYIKFRDWNLFGWFMKIKDNVVDIVIKLLFFYGVWNEGNKYNVIIKRNKVNRKVVNFIVL